MFTTDDVDILIAITNHVATSLETARAAQLAVAVQAARRQRDVAETLRAAMAEQSATLDPDEVMRRLLRSLAQTLDGDAAALLTRQGESLVVTASHGHIAAVGATLDPAPRCLLDLTMPAVRRPTGAVRRAARPAAQLAGDPRRRARRPPRGAARRLGPRRHDAGRAGRGRGGARRPGHDRVRERPAVQPGAAAGHDRRAHRPLQPRALLRRGEPAVADHAAVQAPVRGDHARHRPLQADQRHLRAPGRRRGHPGGRRPPARRRPRQRPRRPVRRRGVRARHARDRRRRRPAGRAPAPGGERQSP